jgi:hypothetical protein
LQDLSRAEPDPSFAGPLNVEAACLKTMNQPLSTFSRARRGGSLKFELIAVLLVKAVLLFALKELFFSHPAAEHMQLPPADVAQALLGTPASAQGVPHAK